MNLVILLFVFICVGSRAEVALLLQEPVGRRGAITHAGHASIYLSRVCPQTPFSVRMCEPGEDGVVISKYPAFAPGVRREWMAMSPLPYLYAVEDTASIPAYVSPPLRDRLLADYWSQHLASAVPASLEGRPPSGEWREMLGSNYKRDIFLFRIETTPEQDQELVAWLNARKRSGRFNLATNNCADFARAVLNHYLPGATGRSWAKDFGITSPKSLARSLTLYARKHPTVIFAVEKLSQPPGTFRRSWSNRFIAELPLGSPVHAAVGWLVYPYLPVAGALAYLTTGPFDAERAVRAHRDTSRFESPGLAYYEFRAIHNRQADQIAQVSQPTERAEPQ